MLGLKLATDPRWVKLAEKSIEEILIDHAYCEQKATSTCISIIINFPEYKDVVKELTPIVSEEWSHFKMVLNELDKRGLSLTRMRKDEYVSQLSKAMIKGGNHNDRLVEKLLLAGLIEARSCERFRLLSLHISDDNLKEFYHKLMISEAGHYRLFLDLATKYSSEKYVKKRFDEMLDLEAKILQSFELRGDRVH